MTIALKYPPGGDFTPLLEPIVYAIREAIPASFAYVEFCRFEIRRAGLESLPPAQIREIIQADQRRAVELKVLSKRRIGKETPRPLLITAVDVREPALSIGLLVTQRRSPVRPRVTVYGGISLFSGGSGRLTVEQLDRTGGMQTLEAFFRTISVAQASTVIHGGGSDLLFARLLTTKLKL